MLLRYVLLELVLSLWHYGVSLYSLLLNATQIGAMLSIPKIAAASGSARYLWIFLPILLNYLPEIGSFLIFLSIGWPLFKDANAIIGIDLRKIFRWRRTV